MNIKLILSTVLLAVTLTTTAQIGIGRETGFGVSAILEFGTQARGIRLVPVNDATTLTATAGTIVFDGATGSFRYYDGTSWSTAKVGGCSSCDIPSIADASDQGVLIGTTSSSAKGNLILGADSGETRGLVLPNVAFAEGKIPNPAEGLMVYDTSTNTIKVFNGNFWSIF